MTEQRKLVERLLGGPAPAPVAPPKPVERPETRPAPHPAPPGEPKLPPPWRRRTVPSTRPKLQVYAEAEEFLRINGFTEFVKES